MANEQRPAPVNKPVAPAKPLLQEKPAVLKPTTAESYRLAGPAQPVAASVIPAALKEPRLASLDAFRGFIMLLMVSSGLRLAEVLKNFNEHGLPRENRFIAWLHAKFGTPAEYDLIVWLHHKLDHVAWQGGVFWDLIQPAFMFMVGVSLPYSNARRAARGDSFGERLWHTIVRCVVLVALAVFLANPAGGPPSNVVFTNVLAQIGLGYLFVFLLANRGLAIQLGALAVILVGGWLAFFLHPLPKPDFDYTSVGVPYVEVADADGRMKLVPDPRFVLPGMKAHWSKNTNFAAAVDRDLLNRFPRWVEPTRNEKESDEQFAARRAAYIESRTFRFQEGGYATLNFVPAIATMLLGLMIGELLRSDRNRLFKLQWMLIAGAVCLAVGIGAGYTVCPIIKRIWTPSWALASGGMVIWMLMLFYLLIDCTGQRWLAWPLAVVGMNSIVVYMMSQLLKGWTTRVLYTHLTVPWAKFAAFAAERTGKPWNTHFLGAPTDPYKPMYEIIGVLVVFWLVCVWLWRQRLFVRI